MTASQILSAIAPQFDSDPNRNSHLQLAVKRTNSVCFGENYNYAIALRAAHTLTVTQTAQASGGAGGSITSKREGDLAITFSTPSSSSGGSCDDLCSTSYGRELKGLIAGNLPAVSVCGIYKPPCE